MNPYIFNSMAQTHLRRVIAESLNIDLSEVYKVVKDIKKNTVETHDGRFFKIELTEIENKWKKP